MSEESKDKELTTDSNDKSLERVSHDGSKKIMVIATAAEDKSLQACDELNFKGKIERRRGMAPEKFSSLNKKEK